MKVDQSLLCLLQLADYPKLDLFRVFFRFKVIMPMQRKRVSRGLHSSTQSGAVRIPSSVLAPGWWSCWLQAFLMSLKEKKNPVWLLNVSYIWNPEVTIQSGHDLKDYSDKDRNIPFISNVRIISVLLKTTSEISWVHVLLWLPGTLIKNDELQC